MKLPFIDRFGEKLDEILNAYPNIQFLSQETREKFSGVFPMHNRYFSNGDKPLVALIKKSGFVELTYLNKKYLLQDGECVLFDDSEKHSWVMKNCDLEIFYYRQTCAINGIKNGDYCLDAFFNN